MMRMIRVSLIVFVFLGILFSKTNGSITDQLLEILKRFIRTSCNCSSYYCCSKWGYCGKTDAYCGDGCQSGPCKTPPTTINPSFIITPELFQCVFPEIEVDLRTRRLQGLTEAMTEMKWKPMNNIEAAIFLAHVAHETDGLNTLAEYCAIKDTCNNYQSSWCSIQPSPNMKYYGRGMLRLSYPCNYYNAGKALGLDLLKNPNLVSQSDKTAAATAIWFYKESGMNELAQQGHFGGTTRKLNEYECSGKSGYYMQAARVNTYHRVRKCFGLPEATVNLTC